MLQLAGGEARVFALAARFYEKLFEDDLLPAIFADPSENHAERLAWFLIESMGGPRHHTRERGGFMVAVRAHQDVNITEELRARWVKLMLEACDELSFTADFREPFDRFVVGVSHRTVNAFEGLG